MINFMAAMVRWQARQGFEQKDVSQRTSGRYVQDAEYTIIPLTIACYLLHTQTPLP